MTFKERFKEFIKDKDLNKFGVFYTTPKSNIKEEYKKWYADDDCDYVSIEEHEISDVCIDITSNDVVYDYTDEVIYEDVINSLMNHERYEHFLVVGYGCNWLRQTGYKIVDSYYQAFYRNDDVGQYYKNTSKGGKSVLLREFSHDVPTGYQVIIIGLTDSEYQKLDNSCYDDVIAFSNKHLERLGE